MTIGTIYTFAGMGGGVGSTPNPVISGGMAQLARKLDAPLEVSLSGTGEGDWQRVADAIIGSHKAGTLQRPLCLIGHSKGGEAIIRLARRLAEHGILVDYLAIIELTMGDVPPVPSNVALTHHFEATFSAVNIGNNLKFSDDYEKNGGQFRRWQLVTTHIALASHETVHQVIIETIKSLQDDPAPARPARFYIGKGAQISEADIVRLAAENGIPPYLALACAYKESASLQGSWSSGALNALYEDHVAWRNTSGAVRDALVQAGLAAPGWRDLPYPPSPYPSIDRCAEIAGQEVAALSTSWGIYQVLGENHKLLGFDTALAMVRWLAISERNQFLGWIRTIDAFGIRDALLAEDWHGYSRAYNGPAYASHGYHTKLAALAARFAEKYGKAVPQLPADSDPLLPAPVDPSPPLPGAPGANVGVLTPADIAGLSADELMDLIRRADALRGAAMDALEARIAELKSTQARQTAVPIEAKGPKMTFDFVKPNSKTFWTGALSVAAGLAMLVLPADNMIVELARSFYSNADPGTLITVGLGLIFGREAIAKNGIGN